MSRRNKKSDNVETITHCWMRDPMPGPPPRDFLNSVTADDLKWFEDHPGENTRIRLAGRNEFWPVTGVEHVAVLQVRPGHRFRVPLPRRTGRVQ